ncbi:hypothetical protein [Rossellomorea marisflavi]|uniref:hypothetical protein n=1 Tax=Rossellomorea marisflavi TaxID=189381 RepID=UPI0009A6572D|nr:hypothetical protein [Rossellomorea marisflavi]
MTQLFIAPHAQERLKQRFGIHSLSSMRSFAEAKKKDGKLKEISNEGRKIYRWGSIELIFTQDEKTLITVIDTKSEEVVAAVIENVVVKEARKMLTVKSRVYRKEEIRVAEITLNMLKAKNPKIKAKLSETLASAKTELDRLKTDIRAIRTVAKKYGVNL